MTMDNIFWLGHAAFLLLSPAKTTVYIDPFNLTDKLPKADIILVTHKHYDHFSPGDINKILKRDTVLVCPPGVCAQYKETAKIKELKPRGKTTIKNIPIEAVYSYNTYPEKQKYHPKKDGNLGYIISIGGEMIYHAGDTDVIPEMKKYKADIALLPVGGTYTMDAVDAAKAVEMIKPKIAIPMHWGSIVGGKDAAEKFKELVEKFADTIALIKEPSTP